MRSARLPPPGIRLARSLGAKEWSRNAHRGLVLVLTFIAYACYHASRKPTSIVKSVLDPEPQVPKHHHPQFLLSSPVPALDSLPWPAGPVFVAGGEDPVVFSGDSGRPDGWPPSNGTNGDDPVGVPGDWRRADGWTHFNGFNRPGFSGDSRHPDGWAPFNGTDGTAKLGEIDVAFLACYSLAMYAAGHLGDMLDLRLFLATGMIGSGIFVGLFGMGYFWHLHVFGFYLAMQMLAGLLQATGWPSVVAVVGNWFGERKRGLIMGIWNAHTSVGNISGSLLAASVLQFGWGWSFVLPGALIALGGVLVFLFLAAYPEDVGFDSPRKKANRARDEEEGQAGEGWGGGRGERGSAVGFWRACLIPGVIPFALCLFFSKLVAYTFLYWLPFYLSQTRKWS